MEAIQALLTRRSVRQFIPDAPISDETVETLLRAAMTAPTARNCRPWHFVVVRDKAQLQKLKAAHPHAGMLDKASLAIAICGSTQDACLNDIGYLVIDTAAATQNLLLAAHALGLGGVWLGMYPNDDRALPAAAALNLPEGQKVLHLVALGTPAAQPEPLDRYDASRVHHDRW